MALDPEQLDQWRNDVVIGSKWSRRRDVPLAILAWIAVAFITLMALGYIARSLLILAIAALLAYAMTPAVKAFQRIFPRPFAIAAVYLIVLAGLGTLIYLIINTSVDQVSSLAKYIQQLTTPAGLKQISPLIATLQRFGISQAQIEQVGNAAFTQIERVATDAVPLLTGFFNFLLDIILVGVISIYFLLDGSRLVSWLRRNMPSSQRTRTNFLLNTLQRVVGGYIRGQFILAVLIGVMVGIGMAIFRVPYAELLGVMAFVLEFIPVLGTITSGGICVLIALTQGWITALLVLGYFIIVHIFEGDIVGPRVVGHAVGLHPILSLAALVAGSELFGIWGAVFASALTKAAASAVDAVNKPEGTTDPPILADDADRLESDEGSTTVNLATGARENGTPT